MKYYSQYHCHDLLELQAFLADLSKSNRWIKLGDNLPWDRMETEYDKLLGNAHTGAKLGLSTPIKRIFCVIDHLAEFLPRHGLAR